MCKILIFACVYSVFYMGFFVLFCLRAALDGALRNLKKLINNLDTICFYNVPADKESADDASGLRITAPDADTAV